MDNSYATKTYQNELKTASEKRQKATVLPGHDIIITILSDPEYMKNMYNQLNFIKAMQREEMREKAQV